MSMAAARMFQGLSRGIDSFSDTLQRAHSNVAQRAEKERLAEQARREWEFELMKFSAQRSDADRDYQIAHKNATTNQTRMENEHTRGMATLEATLARDAQSQARWEQEFAAEAPVRDSTVARNRAAAQANLARASQVGTESEPDYGAAILRRFGDLNNPQGLNLPRIPDYEEALRRAGQDVYGAYGVEVPEYFRDPPAPPAPPPGEVQPSWFERLKRWMGRNDGSFDAYDTSQMYDEDFFRNPAGR